MTWSSPWDGGDRRVLAVVLAMVACWDLLALAFELALEPSSGLPHPSAPAWLLAIAESSFAVIVVASIGVAAAIAYARERLAIASALVVLVCSGVLVEAAAARGPGPYRARFFIGAMLLGAVIGRVWARIAKDDERRAAEAGAVAMLAATWLGAATSKLGGAGIGWADATTLRAVALAHAPVDGSTPTAWLAHAPGAARAFAIATVIVQAVALLHPWTKTLRAITAIALIGFHVGVAVFAGIGYWEPVVLLLAFSLPWPRWLPRLRMPDEAYAPIAVARAHAIVAALLAVIVALAWLIPWRSYTDLHHRPRSLADGASVARESLATLGPIAVGDRLAGDWRIDAIAREPTRAMVVLRHGEDRRAVLWVSPRLGDAPGSPFDRTHVRLAYEGRDATALTPAARELGARLDAAANSPADVAAWLAR
ncbi:MAG TPA: hypothetical protein VG755_22675 [Nannocystaceae bacterium]|nr:hypothetical protein [Nannocystaceae bacterium]